MIKLILKEKKNDLFGSAISLMLFVLFFSIIMVILNLITDINIVNNSRWFEDIANTISADNVFIQQKINMLHSVITIYGTTALVIIALLYIVVINSYVEKSNERVLIMRSVGYSKWQVFGYRMKSFLIDMAIILIPVVIVYYLLAAYIREHIGLEKIFQQASMEQSMEIEGMIVIYVLAAAVMGIRMIMQLFKKDKCTG